MKTLKIYDPAMCCSSGVCGQDVDDTLVQLSSFLSRVDTATCTVERYNLSQEPAAFAGNAAVTAALQKDGTDALPLVYVDDQLVSSGSYPELDDLAKLLDQKIFSMAAPSSDCCDGGCGS